ncbi:MAG TPA: hypothetical protein VLA35_04215 [Thermoleophilia bacterium]|nr:hypothetical protein [Thermoleophilia bacterium]
MNSLPIIIAVAAAAAVVVLVLVVVLVSRRRKAGAAADESAGSFLGSRPQDTFAGLGEPETPAETADDEFRLDWGHTGDDLAATTAPVAPRDEGATAQEYEPASPDEGEPSAADESEPSGPEEGGPAAATADETAAEAAEETAGATKRAVVVEADDVKGAHAAGHEAGIEAEDVTEAPTADHEAAGETEDVTEAPVADRETVAEAEVATEAPRATPGDRSSEPPARRMVPLSDIIVTTSRKMVDLDDPEVRRMLTELVRYEIDQASEFSAAGQTVDAILQLTEAEKVSRTLGMDETAARIKTMMRELRD